MMGGFVSKPSAPPPAPPPPPAPAPVADTPQADLTRRAKAKGRNEVLGTGVSGPGDFATKTLLGM